MLALTSRVIAVNILTTMPPIFVQPLKRYILAVAAAVARPQRTSHHIWLKPDKSYVSRRRGSSTTSHRFGISLADSLRSQRHKSYASLLPITRGFRAILRRMERIAFEELPRAPNRFFLLPP